MQKLVVNHWMNLITKYNSFDQVKLEEIKYGLTGLYLTISKAIIIFIISIILNIVKETFILLLLFNLIRLTSFGIHAKKSWICLITSIVLFIGVPLLIINIKINYILKVIIGIINIIFIYLNSPADTKKRPIINKKRRAIYKYISTLTAIIYTILSFVIKDNYIVNSLIFSLIIQNILISPITYKIFNEPYNNYIEHLNKNV